MNVLKLILRIILYVTGGVMVLLLLLGSLTQTQFFRDRLRAFALAELDSLLVAEVTMGDLHGNLVTGFSVDGLTLTLDGDTVLSASQVGVRYDLFEIASRTISFHTIVLDRPTIHLLRSRSGVWNIERIAGPSPPDTTSSRFDWALQLRRLDIRQGVVMLVDSTALNEPRDPEWPRNALDYDHLVLREFTLGLSFSMRDDVYRAGITRLAFVAEGTPLRCSPRSGSSSNPAAWTPKASSTSATATPSCAHFRAGGSAALTVPRATNSTASARTPEKPPTSPPNIPRSSTG